MLFLIYSLDLEESEVNFRSDYNGRVHEQEGFHAESLLQFKREEMNASVFSQDPLNSGDDVSEQDIPEIFDTENVIVCQYDKVKNY